jgi:GH25 family lysozyme M1 (1,4-beta-N-acetylmuramidase)
VLRRLLTAACSVVVTAGLVSAAQPVSARIGTGPPHVRTDVGALATTSGIDVSRWQGTINWESVHNAGVQFAYLKATEGTGVKDPNFNAYYPAAYYAGLIRGAYHFARPNLSAGSTQADYFASSGGAWSADNQTLPGALDLEPNPYSGGYCYGLSQSGMVSWISSFMDQYHARTGRWAVIQTTASFWRICTGNHTGFASRHPLWIIQWDTSTGTLPTGWSFYTLWQHTNCLVVSGISGCTDGNTFNGTRDRLIALANNTP